MADYTPWWLEAEEGVTLTATAAVTGQQVVKVGTSDMSCTPTTAAADDTAIGVAAMDIANAAQGTVFLFGPVHRLVANGAITRGDHVGPGAVAGSVKTIAANGGAYVQGDVNLNSRARLGIALESAADLGTVRVMTVR